jgi:hypothetical protein
MNQTQSPPSIARVTFGIHAVVATVIGALLLVIPEAFGGWFGYASCPDVVPPLRAFGAVLLGLGAVTSIYGVTARSWVRIDLIVRAEITTTALMTIVFVVSAILGSGPLLGNVLFAIVSAILLVLFVVTWMARPE